MLPAELLRAAEENHVLIPAVYDIVWGALSIAVVAVVFVKFVLPTFTKVLDERTEKIEGGLAAGANARAEAEALRAEMEQELTTARVEAARVRQQAQEDGDTIIADRRGQARVEADRILDSAARQIEADRQQAATSLRHDIGALATTLAERIVGESLADDARRGRVIDRFLDELDAQNVGTVRDGATSAAEVTEA